MKIGLSLHSRTVLLMSRSGRTVLHCAVRHARYDVAEKLLQVTIHLCARSTGIRGGGAYWSYSSNLSLLVVIKERELGFIFRV